LTGLEKRRIIDPNASPSMNLIEGLTHRELRDILALDTGNEWKLSPSDIDEIIDDLLPTRRNTMISRPFLNNSLAAKNIGWLKMKSPPTEILPIPIPILSIRLFG
jgi:hypothetical protein